MKMFLLSFNALKHRSIFAVFLAIFLLFGAVKGTKAQESNGSASPFDGWKNLKVFLQVRWRIMQRTVSMVNFQRIRNKSFSCIM